MVEAGDPAAASLARQEPARGAQALGTLDGVAAEDAPKAARERRDDRGSRAQHVDDDRHLGAPGLRGGEGHVDQGCRLAPASTLASGGRRDLIALPLHLLGVLAPAGGAREARPVSEGGLRRREVRLLPAPALERESEQGAPVGEADLPGQALDAAHRVEVGARALVALPAREEDHARNGGRDRLAKAAQRPLRDLLDAGLVWTVIARHDHVGLEQQALARHALLEELAEDVVKRGHGGLVRAVDPVVAVHQHLGLHDRDQTGLLTQRGVSPQSMCVRPQAVARRDAVADGDHRPPLAEASAHLRILSEPVAQTVQALGDLLARRTGERLAPVSTLMPGITPRWASSTGNGTPSELDWRSVSSNRIAPLMCSSIPSVVNTSSRNRQRASSVDSTSTCSRRFDMVALLSSAARMPFPSATISRAVLSSAFRSVLMPAPRSPRLPFSSSPRRRRRSA